MAVLDEVMLRFLARRVPGEAAGLTQPVEVAGAAGDDLVDVSLVARVPHDGVLWAVKDTVQGKSQLHHSQVWRQVPARPRGLLDQERAHLLG